MEFKDEFYKKLGKQAIIDKLQLVDEFETKYKPNTHSIAMRKWCTDYEYRKREWQWRQGVANYASKNAHKILQTK